MNDFTKEELIMLQRLTLQHVNLFRQNSDCIELLRKLSIMIENYLEPEKPKSACECGDKYHPNGFMCLNEAGVNV